MKSEPMTVAALQLPADFADIARKNVALNFDHQHDLAVVYVHQDQGVSTRVIRRLHIQDRTGKRVPGVAEAVDHAFFVRRQVHSDIFPAQ